MSVSSVVREQAHRFFGPAQADEVIAALEGADMSPGLMSADRVHLALLLIAQGDLRKLEVALRQARQVWRDTLVAAGLAEADWPAVLKQHGIEIST